MKQALEKIDFEEDVLLPEIEAMKAGKPVLGLPEGAAFDIEIVSDENSNPRPPSSAH